MNLFTYGTLMDAEIMAALVGRPLAFRKGLLSGHARHPVINACYPGLIPAGAAQTEGIVYRGLEADDWPLLDWFEDVLYTRETVAVELEQGQQVKAQVYVVPPEKVSCLNADAAWCFEDFKRKHYHEYVPMCVEARVHYFQQKRMTP